MLYPTTPTLDDANRADTAAPSGWTIDNNLFTVYRSAATNLGTGIASNRFLRNAGGDWGLSYLTSPTFAEDCEAYCLLPVVPEDGGEAILHVRMSAIGANWQSYRVTWMQNAGTSFTMRLSYVLGGNLSTISTTATDPGASANGQGFGIRAIGSTITARWWNGTRWVTVLTATDANVTGGGKLGIELRGDTVRADDVGGGNLAETIRKSALDYTRHPVPQMRMAA